MISFFEEEIAFKIKDKRKIKNWITAVCKSYKKKVGEINYIFCDDEYLLKVNNEYLSHNFYTDIITFNQSESDTIIEGELYISIDRVKENANDIDAIFEQELKRVIIHGILHLIGYNDKSKEEEKEMRALENKHLGEYEAC